MSDKFHYGGQAIIEGVMMRGEKSVVTAVRHPKKGLIVTSHPTSGIDTGRVKKIPMARGAASLVETLFQGTKSLFYSANISLEEEEEPVKLDGKMIAGIVALSVAFGVGLFFLTPLFLTKLLQPYIESSIVFHLIEGAIRLGIFLIYLKAMTLQSDIRRVFTYHGAEHKTVNAYEHGVPLEVDEVKKYSTVHTRCGTSFLFIVLIIAIFVFALIGTGAMWQMALWRILMVPVIAGLAYEVTRFANRHLNNAFIRATLAPGLMLQSLTTGEPDDSQLEVAVSALKKAVENDHPEEQIQSAEEPDDTSSSVIS